MDRKKACRDITDLFIKAANKYNAIEKIPVMVGPNKNIFHSERHLIDHIGDYPGMNVTELAEAIGVTKGAISQVLKKLETKSLAMRYKKSTNEKEVFVELTKLGKEIYVEHKKTNEETMIPLHKKLKKYSDDNIESFIEVLRWIVGFLDSSKEKMKAHSKHGH